ncbi:hypothetical protein pipiens_007289 [Culex pipiens pipiens]|uniref:Uncharacterized protein n=1 Tax=Culex pipiens pipiens TaxID=38569 RepID=A0ABD1DLN9_CULPP
MIETLLLRGQLSGWVTLIATNPKYPDMILSSSRDVTLIVWKLTRDDASYGIPQKRLYGHLHFSSGVVLSSDGCGYLNSVSVSPDGSLHTSGGKDCKAFLWGLNDGKHLHTLEHQRDLILGGPIQSVRRLRLVDQDLDSCLQDHARGAEAVEGRPAAVPVAGLVHRRTDLDAGYINNIISVWRRIRTAWPITRRSEDTRRRRHSETSSGNHWWKQARRVTLSCSPTSLIPSGQVVSVEPSVFAFITSSTVRA